MSKWESDSIEKLTQIGRHAANIQLAEITFKTADSDGNPVEGTEHSALFIYNREIITEDEFNAKMQDGSYIYDGRIAQIKTDMKHINAIFPHAFDKNSDSLNAYWRSCKYENDMLHCECSNCGYMADNYDAVKTGGTSTEYVGVKWHFCPRCGAHMSYKPRTPEGGQ